MANYFNTLPLREQLDQLGRCRFAKREEFEAVNDFLKVKKWSSLVVVHKVEAKVCIT